MPEPNLNPTVPEQLEPKSPVRKTMPVVIALVVILALIAIANLSSLLKGSKISAPVASLPAMRPAAPNAQQVTSFETLQQLEAARDQEERQREQEANNALQQLYGTDNGPSPEGDKTPPMTKAQRDQIYGESSNAPTRTSEASQARAEAKQRELAKQKFRQDALNSDTVAIDFEHTEAASPALPTSASSSVRPETASAQPASVEAVKRPSSSTPMGQYSFDEYQGRLYRIFEGTVLEGVVTNHIDGGLSGPILVMLTTDYYSHDHQQLLMPQGTRLIGTVQSVGNAQQRKMFVTFHRAICPDGFSLDFDQYVGLDQIGTTGLATKVDHGYLQAFAAAAMIGGLGGLAQIGNNGSILSPSTEIRNGISEQSASEGEQVLNHFLDRLPVITLKEGSRARIYVGRDILVPSYAEHRIDPTL